MKYLFLIIFISIISIIGYFHFSTSTVINKVNEIKNTNFSIEINEDDKKLNIFILGNLFLIENIDLNNIFSQKFINILKKSDIVILEIKNQIFDSNILENLKGNYVISEKIINKLKFFNINHILLNSPTLFSRGNFYYELTVGNILKSEIELIYPLNLSKIKKGDSSIYFITINSNNYKENEIITKIQNLSKQGIVFVFVDFSKSNIIKPSLNSKILAEKLINNGARFVIGNGKDNIQTIECYNNGIIFYSLGSIYKNNKNESIGLSFTIENNKVEVLDFYLFNLYKNHFSFFSDIQKIDFFSDKNNFKNFSEESKENIKNNKLLFNENLCTKK